MPPFLALIWKDVYRTFTDRSLILIMFITPAALATIIGLAFGGLSSGGQINISEIPIAIVNQDAGVQSGGQTINLGLILESILIPGTDQQAVMAEAACTLPGVSGQAAQSRSSISSLIRAERLESVEAARAGVEDGTYRAAILIPVDFSARLSPQIGLNADAAVTPVTLEIYSSPGAPISAQIVNSIVSGIGTQLVRGNYTIAATMNSLIAESLQSPALGLRLLAAQNDADFGQEFACAYGSELELISIQQQPLNAIQTRSAFVQLLVQFGAAQAFFFALFTMQFGLLSIFEERKNGTLQRLLVAPIPRAQILLAKILSNVLTVLIQLVILLVALNVIAIIVEQQTLSLWGDQPLLVLLVLLAVTLSVAGIGAFTSGIARTPEQARIIGPLANAGFAILGGTFGFQLDSAVAQFSPIYWGVDAFNKVAGGTGDISLNLLVLLVQGSLMFLVGSWFFRRRAGF